MKVIKGIIPYGPMAGLPAIKVATDYNNVNELTFMDLFKEQLKENMLEGLYNEMASGNNPLSYILFEDSNGSNISDVRPGIEIAISCISTDALEIQKESEYQKAHLERTGLYDPSKLIPVNYAYMGPLPKYTDRTIYDFVREFSIMQVEMPYKANPEDEFTLNAVFDFEAFGNISIMILKNMDSIDKYTEFYEGYNKMLNLDDYRMRSRIQVVVENAAEEKLAIDAGYRPIYSLKSEEAFTC